MTIASALILIVVGLGLLSTFSFSRVPTGRMQALFRTTMAALVAMALIGEGMWMVFGR